MQQQVRAPDGVYVCPRTRAPLRQDGSTLKGDIGGPVYELRNGIPRFLSFGAAETVEIAAQLERLNELAGRDGWLAALQTVYAADPGMVRYVTAGDRASFVELLPIDRTSHVLEIGPGLGQFTVPLARRAAFVSALEVVAGQAEFVVQRCREEGLRNVDVAVGGDDCRLPYADASFDLIVLNLVFEWCASRCSDEEPIEVQRRLLAEMARVLKPGGSLYLATKNRYALRYVIGKGDEHMHYLPFGNALPRWLGRLALHLKALPRAPGLLHSHAALGRMLRQAGFDRLRSFWATPEMRYPAEYVPTDPAAIRAARRRPGFVQGDARSVRLLMRWVPAPLVKHLTPGLAFVATKGATQPSTSTSKTAATA